MVSLSTLLHIRIPFSYFLLPIFLFSLAISPNVTMAALAWTFFLVHFLLYPASNGYNSYFDKDEKSIGGLKNPPPVKKDLYYFSLLLDVVAVAGGLIFVNIDFAAMLFIYGLVSKAYSHPSIRLKRYAISGWLVTGVFQGFFALIMCYIGINRYEIETAFEPRVMFAGVLATLMLWANYPMTQIYQHEEDAKHGDKTLSMALGIRGTFYFVGSIFTIVTAGFFLYFQSYFGLRYSIAFVIALSLVVLYFGYWFMITLKDRSKADYIHTMWLNFISATSLNAYFIFLFLDSSRMLDAFQ